MVKNKHLWRNILIYIYALLVVMHLGLIWLLPYLPTQDGPSHLLNLIILRDLIHGGSDWGNYFSFELRAMPNYGFLLLAYPMLEFLSPLTAEKVFVSLYFLFLGIAIPYFVHTFNRRNMVIVFFVFPIFFNDTFLMGFYSYIVTIPVYLCALVLCWKARDTTFVRQFILFNSIGLMIYYFHIIPFIFFLIALLSLFLIQSSNMKSLFFNLIRLFFITLPLTFIALPYLLQTNLLNINKFHQLSDGGFSKYFFLTSKLLLFSMLNLSPWQMLPVSIILIVYLLLVLSSFRQIIKTYQADNKIRIINKFFMFQIMGLIIIYFVMPNEFGGGAYFKQRLPWIIFILSLAVISKPPLKDLNKLGVLVLIAAVSFHFMFSAFFIWRECEAVKAFNQGLTLKFPKGAFIMTYKPEISNWPFSDTLIHAASYYGIFKHCVDIGNYETNYDYFPVKFKNTIPKFPSEKQISYAPRTINWAKYPAIQYIIGWHINPYDRMTLTKFYHLIWEKGLVTIWQRKQSIQPN